jgi:peptidoglycan/LPS O-acetylase OafA/YrhL
MARLHSKLGPGSFRLVLALLVVLSHLTALGIGRPAVMLFFMLSGYWVSRMYEQKYMPAGPILTAVWLFYVSRLLRIWLPFAVAFLGTFAVYFFFAQAKSTDMLFGLTLLGIASTRLDILGTAWSLDIELQFYLLVPVIWALLSFSVKRVGLFWPVCSVMGLTAFGWYLQMTYGLWTVLSYLPPFVAGTLVWLSRSRASRGLAIASVGLFAIVGLAVLLVPYLRPFLIYGSPVPFEVDWFGMAWVVLLLPFVAWNVQQKSSWLDMHFGNYSYALYITHWPVIAFLQPLLAPLSRADKLLSLAVIAVISVIFYLAVDRQCERFRRKLVGRISSQKLTG